MLGCLFRCPFSDKISLGLWSRVLKPVMKVKTLGNRMQFRVKGGYHPFAFGERFLVAS